MTTITFLRSSVNPTPVSLSFGQPAFSDVSNIKRFYIGDVNNQPYLVGDSQPLAQAGNGIEIDTSTTPPTISVKYDTNSIDINSDGKLYVIDVNGGTF